MPTPARREISAIDTSASGSANAERAAARILPRLRSASARLAGDVIWSGGAGIKWTVYPVVATVKWTGSPPADASDLTCLPRPVRGLPKETLHGVPTSGTHRHL